MPSLFSRALFAALLMLILLPLCAAAQEPSPPPVRPYRIAYRLAMPRPETHLFEVQIDADQLGGADYIDFQMPRWSPGRYAVFDFARNVQEVSAASGVCPVGAQCKRAPLPVTRLDTQTWRVSTKGADGVSLRYKVFADDLSGTFSQLDTRHANFNGASLFMYVFGHKQDPVRLAIEAPRGWRIVNGYSARPEQTDFAFANYDLLIDTPTEIAPDWKMESFRVDGKLYRVVVHAFGKEGGRREALARDIERIVRAETTLMGTPEFDSYTFIMHFDPTARRGDGMEHLTSTQIIEVGELNEEDAYQGAIGTAAHEFFHVWNVKRLRPAGLGPWDFTRPVETRGLWVAEGFTNYYGKLSLRRSGIWSDDRLLESYSAAISQIENSPGSRLMSAEEASLLASFLDRATSEQNTNLGNTSVSYYPKGETLAFVLDLLIRGRTGGRASLDDVMRRMYEEFYLKSPAESYYLKGRGFTNEDLARVASQVAGFDLRDFFTRHAAQPEPPPYAEACAALGLRFVRRPAAQGFTAGITLDNRAGRQARISSISTGSPAQLAGLRQGDVIVSIGGTNVYEQTWRAALNKFRQGEGVPLVVDRNGQTVSTVVTLAEPELYDYRIEKNENATAAERALRDAWLSGTRR